MGAAEDPWVEPDTARLLARMAVDFADAPGDPTVEQRRQGLDIAAQMYGPPLAEVGAISWQKAWGPDGPVSLRVYTPLGPRRRRRPIVVHVHGGGWVLGGPEGYERVARAYCAAGDCILVDVEYRRAPEHRHPAALQDCVTAIDWTVRNAGRLGGDSERLVVTGDSAGGHLAAAACQSSRHRPALQILVYPVMTASAQATLPSRSALGDGRFFLREFDILRAEAEYFTPEHAHEREQGPASPLLATRKVLRRQPPTLAITAALDPLVDEGAAYVEALRRAGVDAEEIRIPGTIHAFVLFAGELGVGRDAIAEIGRRIRAVKPRRRSLLSRMLGH
ncbi:MAG: alpha/beta hydrolase [Caulobacteraceae bacterium]|nr:MAG: alpha/beta hydrolase [Caulobacteraceae bacterium]